MESKLVGEIRSLISPILEQQRVDLVDLELKGKPGSRVLRIFVDTDGGISLDHCVALSRQISDLLDTRDLISGHYRLEVSSPGLDRPLRTPKDFKRNLGRQVKIKFATATGEPETVTGRIARVTENTVTVGDNDRSTEIDITTISVAKVLPVW